ncbi:MAG: class I tRNA ligase family protein [Patescibacteria group bacterium]|nr:class I tRNA ligase family protein [Patescibacteria group bacterium]
MLELPKAYEPKEVEKAIYQKWDKSGFFNPDKLPGKRSQNFSISLPPPNATGILHIGHAVMLAIQDLLIRFERMRGKKTLWLPGTDHAAIATQNVVEQSLKAEGKTKNDLGREKFLERINEYVASKRNSIREQVVRLGSSCDWSRERFTLDAGLSNAVATAFKTLYDDGLIYRGDRIVNWCPRCQSTLADDEVEYVEKKTPFYYFKYGPVVIGTARPETKFGDKAIIVHPDDKRYQKMVGKEFEVEWILGKIKARVIADPAADPAMGSGAMTITPGHSFVDFELAKKHNIEIEKIIDERGCLTEAAGEMKGLPVREARKRVVEILRAKGLIEKIDENYLHNLSVCYRCGTPVEPLVSKQWFLAVDQPTKQLNGKTLKTRALEVIDNKEIEFVPERFGKIYRHWMTNLHDWCISRQIWYGHRIPVWHRGKEIVVSGSKPKGEGWSQEIDTLDTWFSSSLWTFSTLGWPIIKEIGFDASLVDLVKSGKKTKTFRLRDHNLSAGETCFTHDSKTKKKFGYLRIISATKIRFDEIELHAVGHEPYKSRAELNTTFQKYYPDIAITSDTPVWLYEFVYQKKSDLELFHPTSVMETGYDLIFFWVARMILMSTYLIGEVPFKTVFLHGLVRDKKGRKMSKSLGNGIDPSEMADKYGADAVRLSLIIGTSPGNDQKLDEQKIAGYRNYVNKVWNIGRFLAMQTEGKKLGQPEIKTLADKWIISQTQNLLSNFEKQLEKYLFSAVGESVYDFTWHSFADWYLEIVKVEGNVALAKHVFGVLLKLLHPYMPFVTEYLWSILKYDAGLLMIAPWPDSGKDFLDWKDDKKTREDIETEFGKLMKVIIDFRRQRKEAGVPLNQPFEVKLDAKNNLWQDQAIIEKLARVKLVKA